MFELTGELSPTKVIHVYEPAVGLRAIRVVDNVARGPCIGGPRSSPDRLRGGLCARPGFRTSLRDALRQGYHHD